jgi:hypothetical protein
MGNIYEKREKKRPIISPYLSRRENIIFWGRGGCRVFLGPKYLPLHLSQFTWVMVNPL